MTGLDRVVSVPLPSVRRDPGSESIIPDHLQETEVSVTMSAVNSYGAISRSISIALDTLISDESPEVTDSVRLS